MRLRASLTNISRRQHHHQYRRCRETPFLSSKQNFSSPFFQLIRMMSSSSSSLNHHHHHHQQQQQPQQPIYRRELPTPPCTAFASYEGRQMFKEALLEGGMETYFNLAPHFRTQDEPAYCGVSTLTMVLNSLSVDPGRVWKGVWRDYHEDMLDTCQPLDEVKTTGINFDEFVCMAQLHRLTVKATRAVEGGVDAFREVVKRVCTGTGDRLVVSYTRKGLQQTGDGHFSPIGGYHQASDSVLVMDVARFKYPPHWVSIEILYNAMLAIDPSTGQSRGYVTLCHDPSHVALTVIPHCHPPRINPPSSSSSSSS